MAFCWKMVLLYFTDQYEKIIKQQKKFKQALF